MLKSLLSNKEKLLEVANTPLNENYSAVILKKLPKKLGDPGKFLIPCGFSKLKCKALADLGASINLMPLLWSVWKNLGLPELISTQMTLELANRVIFTPKGIARDVFVPVGKFTFLADFVIVDYKSDPQFEAYLANDSFPPGSDDTNFDPEGDLRLSEELLNNNPSSPLPLSHNPLNGSTISSSPDHLLEEFANELALITFPPRNDDLPFDIESDLREIEYLLRNDPTKEMDSILKDSVDEGNLADPNNDLVDTIPEMFTDEHTLDYSSPPLYDDVDDDLVELESDIDDVYDDPFDSKEDKIKESKLLIDELDSPGSSIFLPQFLECDSVFYEDFSNVDTLT
ncbi:reverse transcriptase domain-containing protein [Tanacetum coccineum]